MKNYEEIEKGCILNTVSILIVLENKGLVTDWNIRRDLNTWNAWYQFKNDSHLIGGSLIDTTQETVLNELERVRIEHLEWLNS